MSNHPLEYDLPVRMKAVGDEAKIDRVVIRDNVMRYTDHGAVTLADGGAWGVEFPSARLYDVKVLRNALFQIGRRPTRYGHGHAIEIDCAEAAEIAGNVGYRLHGSGIFVFGGKRSAAKVDRPLTRILIHHNKIVDSLLNTNDWGGIETWQGGPAYVFNNISGNPRGFKTWGYKLQPDRPATSTFGHAYYMDGGFKQYYFNNITWGGEAQAITGKGPYAFRFKPVSKPGLSHFIITAWLTPSGEWSDHTEIARFGVAMGQTAPEQGYRSPQVRTSNFLLEVYFRTEPAQDEGVLLEKMGRAGYGLAVNRQGGVSFSVRADRSGAELTSRAKVNDGSWHHVVAEADRGAKAIRLYVDGKLDAAGAGIGAGVSLASDADLLVGGTPEGRCLAGNLEFARIALGTLADAKTTIEELYAWQFDGPFLRDWTGRKPSDGKRDAGAIESE